MRVFVAQRWRIIVAGPAGRLTGGHFHDGLDSDRDRCRCRPRLGCCRAGAGRVGARVRRERPLSEAQLKKINGWIADQGKDIAVSAIITEILGLTKNDQTISARGYAALDPANGNEIHQIFILPEGKGYLADHFHQDKVEVYWADKDLVLLTALSGVRGAKPEVMFFQDAQAGVQQ